ncbi:MAG: hypothetical protein MMC33_008073 [Icmadophila ericetorum]|nr:hypothetical protein [Icmadophila ericetorum]
MEYKSDPGPREGEDEANAIATPNSTQLSSPQDHQSQSAEAFMANFGAEIFQYNSPAPIQGQNRQMLNENRTPTYEDLLQRRAKAKDLLSRGRATEESTQSQRPRGEDDAFEARRAWLQMNQPTLSTGQAAEMQMSHPNVAEDAIMADANTQVEAIAENGIDTKMNIDMPLEEWSKARKQTITKAQAPRKSIRSKGPNHVDDATMVDVGTDLKVPAVSGDKSNGKKISVNYLPVGLRQGMAVRQAASKSMPSQSSSNTDGAPLAEPQIKVEDVSSDRSDDQIEVNAMKVTGGAHGKQGGGRKKKSKSDRRAKRERENARLSRRALSRERKKEQKLSSAQQLEDHQKVAIPRRREEVTANLRRSRSPPRGRANISRHTDRYRPIYQSPSLPSFRGRERNIQQFLAPRHAGQSSNSFQYSSAPPLNAPTAPRSMQPTFHNSTNAALQGPGWFADTQGWSQDRSTRRPYAEDAGGWEALQGRFDDQNRGVFTAASGLGVNRSTGYAPGFGYNQSPNPAVGFGGSRPAAFAPGFGFSLPPPQVGPAAPSTSHYFPTPHHKFLASNPTTSGTNGSTSAAHYRIELARVEGLLGAERQSFQQLDREFDGIYGDAVARGDGESRNRILYQRDQSRREHDAKMVELARERDRLAGALGQTL